eukprot:1556274-Alexandrium_andersonii.AAC.1
MLGPAPGPARSSGSEHPKRRCAFGSSSSERLSFGVNAGRYSDLVSGRARAQRRCRSPHNPYRPSSR